MEQRQPGDAARGPRESETVEELDDVGDDVAVCDLHAGRDAGGAGGVLQVGDVVGRQFRTGPAGTELVGDGVDGDGARTLAGRQLTEQGADTGRGLGGGEDHRGGAVAENRVQPIVVAGLVRVEQRHRDESGMDRGEERHDVVQTLRGEDRDPVPRLGHLLQACRDGVEPVAETGPQELLHLAVARPGVVHVPVDEPVLRRVLTGGGDVLLDKVDKGGAIRNDDRPAGVVVLLELHVAPFRSVSDGRRRRPRTCGCTDDRLGRSYSVPQATSELPNLRPHLACRID